MMLFFALIGAVAMRAFLFEIKFGEIRAKLAEKHKLFDTFLSCAFCNGFWTGLVTYFIMVYPIILSQSLLYNLMSGFYFAVATGVASWLQRLHTSQWDFN